MKTNKMKKIIAVVACASMLAVGAAEMAEAGAPPCTGIKKVKGAPPMICESTEDDNVYPDVTIGVGGPEITCENEEDAETEYASMMGAAAMAKVGTLPKVTVVGTRPRAEIREVNAVPAMVCENAEDAETECAYMMAADAATMTKVGTLPKVTRVGTRPRAEIREVNAVPAMVCESTEDDNVYPDVTIGVGGPEITCENAEDAETEYASMMGAATMTKVGTLPKVTVVGTRPRAEIREVNAMPAMVCENAEDDNLKDITIYFPSSPDDPESTK